MRLIDADVFNKQEVLGEFRTAEFDDEIQDVIEKIPTAYDMDKVIRKLEDKAIEELGIDRGRFSMDKMEYSSYSSLTLEDVIEIVKSGSI